MKSISDPLGHDLCFSQFYLFWHFCGQKGGVKEMLISTVLIACQSVFVWEFSLCVR